MATRGKKVIRERKAKKAIKASRERKAIRD
jgi:hypothetical protein